MATAILGAYSAMGHFSIVDTTLWKMSNTSYTNYARPNIDRVSIWCTNIDEIESEFELQMFLGDLTQAEKEKSKKFHFFEFRA